MQWPNFCNDFVNRNDDKKKEEAPMLTVTDGRTGVTKKIPITHGRAVSANALKSTKAKNMPGLMCVVFFSAVYASASRYT